MKATSSFNVVSIDGRVYFHKFCRVSVEIHECNSKMKSWVLLPWPLCQLITFWNKYICIETIVFLISNLNQFRGVSKVSLLQVTLTSFQFMLIFPNTATCNFFNSLLFGTVPSNTPVFHESFEYSLTRFY